MLAVGLPALWNAFHLDPSRPLWQAAGQAMLIYGVAVAIPAGFLHGNETGLLLRDLPPLLFLLLPLLAGDLFHKQEHANVLVWAYVFLGLMFGLRSLFEASLFNPSLSQDTRELYYFANSPAVLFAAVFPAGLAMQKYLQRFTVRSLFILVLASLCTALGGLAMAVTLQRASLAWIVAAFALFSLMALRNAPYRLALLAVIGIMAALPFHEDFLRIFGLLEHKTAIYGVNKRGMEMQAVWNAISASPVTMWFGLGWGGTFESPAVGGVRINYTHSFLSGMLLKTGVLGAVLMLAYVSGFFVSVIKLLKCDAILALAVTGPLLIDAILYASYKWLDFGLLLLVVSACAAQLHRSAAYCIHMGSCEDLPSSS